jgi:hypothetical protein
MCIINSIEWKEWPTKRLNLHINLPDVSRTEWWLNEKNMEPQQQYGTPTTRVNLGHRLDPLPPELFRLVTSQGMSPHPVNHESTEWNKLPHTRNFPLIVPPTSPPRHYPTAWERPYPKTTQYGIPTTWDNLIHHGFVRKPTSTSYPTPFRANDIAPACKAGSASRPTTSRSIAGGARLRWERNPPPFDLPRAWECEGGARRLPPL